jgi:hypothetical protein
VATACGAWFVRRQDRRAIRPKQPKRHCWCLACRTVGCDNRGRRRGPSLEVLRISPAPTAITSEEEKAPQNGSFPGARSADGSCRGGRYSYRSQESPPKHPITDGAGGILPNVATEDRLSSRSQVSRAQPCFFKAVSNAVEAVTRVLDGPDGLTPSCGPQTGSHTHPCKPDQGSTLLPQKLRPLYGQRTLRVAGLA